MQRIRIILALCIVAASAQSARAGGWLQGGWLQGSAISGDVVSDAGNVLGDFDMLDGELVAYRPGVFTWQQVRVHADHYYVRNHIGLTWGAWMGPYEGDGLVGATWQVRNGLWFWDVRIADAWIDDSTNSMTFHSDNSDVWRYSLEYRKTRLGAWKNVCYEPEDSGVFVPGTWDELGEFTPGGLTYGCESGVIEKCVADGGYKPWKTIDGKPLDGLHRACVRAARAQYLSDGQSYTEPGRLIDVYDTHRFNRRTRNWLLDKLIKALRKLYPDLTFDYTAADFELESVFTEDGLAAIRYGRLDAADCEEGARCEIINMIDATEDFSPDPNEEYIFVRSPVSEWPTDPFTPRDFDIDIPFEPVGL